MRVGQRRRVVIVGSGSAGGVVGARLSEDPMTEVILVEAGEWYRQDSDYPAHLHSPEAPSLTGSTDWGYTAFYVEPADARPAYGYPRGKIVGGSSMVNGAGAQRGSSADFDDWAAMGNDGWSFADVLPSFVKVESDPEFGHEPYHGTDGSVPIVRRGPSEWSPLTVAWEEACYAEGHPACADLNAPGAYGVGAIPRNKLTGMRAGTARTYIRAACERDNFRLLPNTRANRVVLDGSRAVAIELQTADGTRQLEADQIVLCAGAINTPQLLMLSGIGPIDVLSGLGIPVQAPLDGVGKNLMDHPATIVTGLLKDAAEQDFDGTHAVLKYASELSAVPDLLMFPCAWRLEAFNFDVTDVDAVGAFALFQMVGKPTSKGWLTITSADPSVAPEIHFNFADTEEDMRRLVEITRFAYRLMSTTAMKNYVSEILYLDDAVINDDDLMRGWIRQNVNASYHIVGTCKMGSASDPSTVVDSRLTVHGYENLYIADASIMPQITTGMTNLPCFMIGEHFARFLA